MGPFGSVQAEGRGIGLASGAVAGVLTVRGEMRRCQRPDGAGWLFVTERANSVKHGSALWAWFVEGLRGTTELTIL